MATDIQTPSLVHTNGTVETEHEINEYRKIIKLRNDIYAGNNLRFKPASQPGSVSRSTPQVTNPPSGALAVDKNRLVAFPLPGQLQNRLAPPLLESATQMSESEINDILLAKSEVLVNAEIKLKRQRIEKELRRQVEEKSQAAEGEEDLNLEEVMEKVRLSARTTTRPEEPTQEDVDMHIRDSVPRRQGVQEEEERDTHIVEVSRGKPPPTAPAAMSATRDQEMSLRDIDTGMRSYTNARDTVSERVYSPPERPRYSATSHLRSPAAPQPVRPANMARVESQNQRIIEVDGGVSYGRYPENGGGRVSYRNRASPSPYIKPEPGSPGYRESVPRVHTPERGGRQPNQPSQYDSGGRARYGFPYAPTSYYPPPALPLPVQTHRSYDPYTHRELDPYAYPPPPPPPPPAPVDYTHRSYTPTYVPPVTTAYQPHPVYDDYDRRYPPQSLTAHQPARSGRRSASPPAPYRHMRYPTRTPSPTERAPLHTGYRQSRGHSPPHLGRPMPPPPPPQQPIYAPEYPHAYPPIHPPRERVYGDDRRYYPPPPPPPLPQRPESSLTAREADLRSYRDREYYATAVRASLPPPLPQIPGSGYAPPPPFDYTRAPSRGVSRVPEYHGEGEREWGDNRAPPDDRGRERDYSVRASVRLEERGYLPVRHASVRPGYGERDHTERRREGSRERFVDAPPPQQAMGGFGDRERIVPPRGYEGRYEEGYGERYGKY